MTQQELIEQNVRMTIGDLHLQLIIARARIAELEAGSVPDPKANLANGKAQAERRPDA